MVEISGDVTDAGRTEGRRQTREDRAAQPLDAGRLRLAIIRIMTMTMARSYHIDVWVDGIPDLLPSIVSMPL